MYTYTLTRGSPYVAGTVQMTTLGQKLDGLEEGMPGTNRIRGQTKE